MPAAAQLPPEILPSALPGQVERGLGPVRVTSGVDGTERTHHFLCWPHADLEPHVENTMRTREASSPTLPGEVGLLGRTVLLNLPFRAGGVVSTLYEERQILAFDLHEVRVEEQEMVVEAFAVSRPGVALSNAAPPRRRVLGDNGCCGQRASAPHIQMIAYQKPN